MDQILNVLRCTCIALYQVQKFPKRLVTTFGVHPLKHKLGEIFRKFQGHLIERGAQKKGNTFIDMRFFFFTFVITGRIILTIKQTIFGSKN